MSRIYLNSDNKALNRAYRIALGDVYSNIAMFKSESDNCPVKEKKPCLLAGLEYADTWVRDSSINVYNALGLIEPEIAKNTLMSCTNLVDGVLTIGQNSQYWDFIIWSIGVERYFEYYEDAEFMKFAYSALKNTMDRFERIEFDSNLGLFRGPAVYGDGIAAYPDKFADKIEGNGCSGILGWFDYSGTNDMSIPMYSLSTNCVFYKAYIVLDKLAKKLGEEQKEYSISAANLKKAINKNFWNEKKHTFDYLAHECDYQEGLGLAFVILFDIADEDKMEYVFKNVIETPNGIACVEPSFERYLKLGGYGRHSGTVWPFIQEFWALAKMHEQKYEEFEHDLILNIERTNRDVQMYEIYHPLTGLPYGGLQVHDDTGEISEWKSLNRQTWSATGFLAMIYYGLLGLDTDAENVIFKPYLPKNCSYMLLSNITLFGNNFSVEVKRSSNNEQKRRYVFKKDSLPNEIKIEL